MIVEGMAKSLKIGFVGGGTMCEAFVGYLVSSGAIPAGSIYVAELIEERREVLAQRYGVNVSGNAKEIVGSVDVVFLSVKPQALDQAVAAAYDAFRIDQLVISIAAGKRLEGLAAKLPQGMPLVRVMPNLAARVAEGVSAYCSNSHVSVWHLAVAELLLKCCGDIVRLPEEMFDPVTALSGSGPAFFAYFAEQMVQAAVRLGFTREDANVLAVKTMQGTAKLLLEEGCTPLDLIRRVSSKGGTTEQGMSVLNASDVGDTVFATLKAAADRSAELSG